ncbi:HPP family protein [Brevundimonas sp. SH203]|uniref:HPP family protein n=1 Tax=Brevundimonas sp. SH203 TaxID=345167 RepID=UPI00190F002E|nr:HPP family protein [Brevundimonas sp. SH203]
MFRPILAGATLRDRAFACLGALGGMGLVGFVSHWLIGADKAAHLVLIGSIGASAVLVFAVPASPLAQPWPVLGGNVVSGLVGVVVAHTIPDPMIGAAVAVGVAIAAMSLLGCLHPPGGGTALTPVLVGPSIGWMFPLAPVALNAVLLIGAAWLFHRLARHAYPHRAETVAPGPLAISEADIDAALAELHEPLDVSRDDLKAVAVLAARHAASRRKS